MPERSYKYVPDKGNFRMNHFPALFGEPTNVETGENYEKYLENFEKGFTEFVLMPSKFGKIKEQVLLDKIVLRDKKPPFQPVNTEQRREFGYPKKLKKRRTFR